MIHEEGALAVAVRCMHVLAGGVGGDPGKRLQLMQEKRTEQEVVLAEILNAGVSADPPSGYVDPLSGS